ncbi:MAG TPA: NUDIX domain-containing protein, partial [Dehalococcoidia bacterium]|nr:NUDIX domain-containing protein [Dehalococcoidia bacterium]
MSDLVWSVNPFGGAVIDPNSVPSLVSEFETGLMNAIQTWRTKDIKVAWLEIPKLAFKAIPRASEEGFLFHHATEEYAMMTLQVEENAFVPPYATHYIGIGGVVINRDNEILVVSERYRASGRGPGYKLPGGALQPGEHLAEAAVREVFEETGISTTFQALTFFRHWHGYRYGKSDIYFVARLSPLDNEITMQEEEIVECVEACNPDVIMHTNSTYPSPVNELNLNYIKHLKSRWPKTEIGYSGHEYGLVTTFAAVAMYLLFG